VSRNERQDIKLIAIDPAAAEGVKLIAAERQRQVREEGWTPEHDAQHRGGQLRVAALCYACHAGDYRLQPPLIWPWHPDSWKPKDAITDLVRAGALIAAEIDRLQALEKARD
jgi:hypothetical protein